MPADPDVDLLMRRVAELDERLRAVEAATGTAARSADPDDPSAHVRELAAAGHVIQAIKAYREQTGLGLREAKRRVEELARER